MSKVDEARAIELNNVMQERSSVNRQLLQAKAQYSHQTTLKRKSELTSSELADLPEDIVVYRAVGRMFLKDKLNDVRTEIKTIIDSSTAEAGKLEKTVEVLTGKVAGLDKDIKDMML
eukprot:TRINITY_DN87658_c0_g1_i1.p1 TRINITY_DN87658_c0_g1~~TRINITY_DN87658_c0_g1_i1.p1  ORF type:complete len:117 (+),score=27.35 TRINITY_DN87658_c0_g1_i1:24-374(+)